jgi:hypothetical protein
MVRENVYYGNNIKFIWVWSINEKIVSSWKGVWAYPSSEVNNTTKIVEMQYSVKLSSFLVFRAIVNVNVSTNNRVKVTIIKFMQS